MNGIKSTLCSYKGMTSRNIKVYLKDKMVILLSMLTQIIVLGLYLLFLKDNYMDSVKSFLTDFGSLVTDKDIETLVNSWLVSGVIGTSVVTVALNSLSVMVSDKQERIDYDYNAAPIKSRIIVMSYFSGAVLNTFLVSSILLTAGLVFLGCSGAFLYTVTDIILIYGIVLFGSISASVILMFFASFFKKNSTLSSFGVMVSAAIGFIIGAYIPVSQFSEGVQTAVNLVPGSQIAGMMRNVLMTPAIDNISNAIGKANSSYFVEEMKETFAIKMNVFGNDIDVNFMLIYSLIAIAVFLVLNLISYKISSKRKS